MISVIICSVNPTKCSQTINSLKATIGFQHELIIVDNQEKKWGICKVYNYGAHKANGKYLCFVHEDVIWDTPNWGEILLNFINTTPDCGVIGFAGGEYVSQFHTSWFNGTTIHTQQHYMILSEKGRDKIKTVTINPQDDNFAPVVTLDGFFLMCKKNVWEQVTFDELSFSGFHFYDMDFSLAVHLCGFHNYVCHIINIRHLSRGNYGIEYSMAAKLFRKKYHTQLPVSVASLNKKQKLKYDLNAAFTLWKFGKSISESTTEINSELKKASGKYYFVIKPLVQCLWILWLLKHKIIERQ